MPSKARPMVIQYVAWNTTANAGQTADAANHTLRICKDGVSTAATNAPSEVDGTYAPGLYAVSITAEEMDADGIALAGVSSTNGVAIIPVLITTELLPIAAPGESGGVAITDENGRVDVGHVAGVTVNGPDDLKADVAEDQWTETERAQIRHRLGIDGQQVEPIANGDLPDVKLIVQARRVR